MTASLPLCGVLLAAKNYVYHAVLITTFRPELRVSGEMHECIKDCD